MIDNPQVAPTIRLSLHDSIHMIHREDWMQVAQGASPYLKYDHLLALEDAMCGTMDFHYAIYYCEQNQPMGIAYFQVADLVDNGSAYRAGVLPPLPRLATRAWISRNDIVVTTPASMTKSSMPGPRVPGCDRSSATSSGAMNWLMKSRPKTSRFERPAARNCQRKSRGFATTAATA